ncbi:MAG: TatD family hydrolase [Patescibacteria group bacterium]|nr:TatD family hydrolase [Patescibacteria group bacterium]
MIDTHSHLDFTDYDKDRDEVIARFFNHGGKAIINIGVDSETIVSTLELAKNFENIFCAIGYHPHNADKKLGGMSEKNAGALEEYAIRNKKVVAIGEIGLDYFHNNKNKEQQKKMFIRQIKIAKSANLPIVIHCRDAYEDLFEIISRGEYKNMKVVVHCYGGNILQTEQFLSLKNLTFSFTGNITFPKKEDAEIFKVIRMIPSERIMVETDCPFLAPVPARGKRNESLYVRYVIEKISKIRKVIVEDFERITDNNACNFFNLSL